jgi:VanZ family protein
VHKLLQHIKNHWLLLSSIILITITALSLWPLSTLPSVPGTDKTHHIIAYMILMFPIVLGRPNKWLLAATLLISYSGIIELIQPYVNRHAEWMDLLANTIGILLGVVLAKFCLIVSPELQKALYSQRD